jgi:hypothetical protein
MQHEEQNFEAETWQGEYLETWPRLPLGLRRHLARIAPPSSLTAPEPNISLKN